MLEEIKPEEVVQEQQREVQSEREYNFKMMRDRAEAAERRAAEIEAQYAVRQQQTVQPAEDDSELVERRYVKQLERKYQESENQREADKAALSERLLRQSYKDFDEIVTTENIQKLARKKPALYRSIQHNPDMYDKGESAYDAIKTFVGEAKYVDTNKKLEANLEKPRPATSMAPQQPETPMANMDYYSSGDGRRRLSPERVKELQAKMAAARGNYW